MQPLHLRKRGTTWRSGFTEAILQFVLQKAFIQPPLLPPVTAPQPQTSKCIGLEFRRRAQSPAETDKDVDLTSSVPRSPKLSYASQEMFGGT